MKICIHCGHRFATADWACPVCQQTLPMVDGFVAFAPDLAHENDGLQVESFARLAQLEAGNFWFRSRNWLLLWALRHYFPQTQRFLEIGCGTGFVLDGIRRATPQMILAGSEIFTQGLLFARQRLPEITFYQMDARQIPFEQEFDVIGAFDVLEHIQEDTAVLSQLFQATRPGGGIMLTVPQHPFLWSALDDYSMHKRRYTRGDLIAKVEQAGFTILRATSFVTFLLPLMVLSRLRKHSMQSNFDPAAEFRIGATLNRFLETILGCERLLIQRGISFPAGGSLLIVARR
jgi:SAM-dependent methyltransferase